jgi:hypothetical protein
MSFYPYASRMLDAAAQRLKSAATSDQGNPTNSFRSSDAFELLCRAEDIYSSNFLSRNSPIRGERKNSALAGAIRLKWFSIS